MKHHLIHFSLQEIKKHTHPQQCISGTAKPALLHIGIHTQERKLQRPKKTRTKIILHKAFSYVLQIHVGKTTDEHMENF
jgi:hypothetical protein